MNGKEKNTYLYKLVLRNSCAALGNFLSCTDSTNDEQLHGSADKNLQWSLAISKYTMWQITECITYTDSDLRLQRWGMAWVALGEQLDSSGSRTSIALRYKSKRPCYPTMDWLTTYYSPSFRYCRNWGQGTCYNEYTRDSVRILVSPIDHIKG